MIIPAGRRLEQHARAARSLQTISFCFSGATDLLAVEKRGPAHYQREDPGALLKAGPEERRCWYTVGVSMVKRAKWGHYGMHLGLGGILFSLHVSETQVKDCYVFALLKREMIQPFSAIVKLQVWPTLHKLNGLLKVYVLDNVLAVLLLIYAVMFVLVYKCKYFLRYLKSHIPVLCKKNTHPSPF